MFSTELFPELHHWLSNPNTSSSLASSLLCTDKIKTSSSSERHKAGLARFLCFVLFVKQWLAGPLVGLILLGCNFLKTARNQPHVMFHYFQWDVHLKYLFLFSSTHAPRHHSTMLTFIFTYFKLFLSSTERWQLIAFNTVWPRPP